MSKVHFLVTNTENFVDFAAETINYVVDLVTQNFSAIEEIQVFLNCTQSLFLSKDIEVFYVPSPNHT
jgi:hypothetical protein